MSVIIYTSLVDAMFSRGSYSMSGQVFNTVRFGRLVMPERFFNAAIIIPFAATVLFHAVNLITATTVDDNKLRRFNEYNLIDVNISRNWHVEISIRGVLNFILEFLTVYSTLSIAFEVFKPIREYIASSCLIAGKESVGNFFRFFVDNECSLILSLTLLNVFFTLKRVADIRMGGTEIAVQFSGRKERGLGEDVTVFNAGNFLFIELLSRCVMVPLIFAVFDRIMRNFIYTSLKGRVDNVVACGCSFLLGAVIKGVEKIISSLLKEVFPTFVDEDNNTIRDLKSSIPSCFLKGFLYRVITTVADIVVEFFAMHYQLHNAWLLSNLVSSFIDTVEPEESLAKFIEEIFQQIGQVLFGERVVN